MSTTVLERFAYGRPLDPTRDETRIPVVSRDATALVGRILLSSIFLVSGLAKLLDPAGSSGYMAAEGIPSPGTLVYIAGLAELLGGLAIATGFLARVAALGLIVFLAITSLVFHDFWAMVGDEQKAQMVQFMKNLTIAGGLVLLMAYGAGRYSIDAVLRRPMAP